MIVVNKKESNASEKPIALNCFTNKIVVSDKFKHKHLDDNIIRPLCVALPQMSGCIKYFDDSGKNMCFKMEDDNIFLKYNEI